MAKDDIRKNVFIIVNCLWYMDGNYQKIIERANHDSTIATIPQRFVSVYIYPHVLKLTMAKHNMC